MVLKKVSYTVRGKKHSCSVKLADTLLKKATGLMFRKRSPPLLFVFGKEKEIAIHSFFCRPFRAVWLDKDMKATKVVDVKTWKPHLSGRGKYLLEIPLLPSRR